MVVTHIEPDETQLLLQTAAGNRRSFQQLHQRYAPALLATAFRILNNRPDAEDVLQEAFVQIWERAGTFDPKRGKPLTWAMTLTRNKAIDRLRRIQRRRRLHDDIEHEPLFSDSVVRRDSSDDAAAHDAQQIVRSAVIELSDEQRRAIELAFFSGLTQQEIAERLHEPLGTVKARIRRGMMKLRQAIEPRL